MIFAELKGGLGNQLFIIAAALEQARRLDTDLILVPAFKKVDKHAQFHFHKKSLPQGVHYFPTLELIYKPYRIQSFLRGHIFKESSNDFEQSIFEVRNQTLLVGYFQSHRYFPNVFSEILEMIKKESNYRGLEEIAERNELKLATGLHVRMGDYLTEANQKTIGALSNEYYKSALRWNRNNLITSRTIHLFSDFPGRAYARRLTHGLRVESELDTFSSLIRLSSCGSLIISNSTFSLWAAYFANNHSADIITPNKWFASDAKKIDDIYLTNWKQIECSFIMTGNREPNINTY